MIDFAVKPLLAGWIRDLAGLPVRYFCNYALLGGCGIVFELLVLGGRRKWVSLELSEETLLLSTMIAVILQTGAEYFRPDGGAGFLPRLAAGGVHFAFFTLLVVLQVHLDLSLAGIFGFLSCLFLFLAAYEARFRGKGGIVAVFFVFLALMLSLQPDLADLSLMVLSGRNEIIVNVLLLVVLYSSWVKRLERQRKKMPQGGG